MQIACTRPTNDYDYDNDYDDVCADGYGAGYEQQKQLRTQQQLIVALATLNALRFMAALARCDDATTGRIASSSFQDTATDIDTNTFTDTDTDMDTDTGRRTRTPEHTQDNGVVGR